MLRFLLEALLQKVHGLWMDKINKWNYIVNGLWLMADCSDGSNTAKVHHWELEMIKTINLKKQLM